MDNFIFDIPTKLFFGKDSINNLSMIKNKATKVLLHYGGGSIKNNGVYNDVITILEKIGVQYIELSGVKPNPRVSLVREGIQLCKDEKVDFILAVGGGSVIDSAKAIASGIVLHKDIWDYYKGAPLPSNFSPIPIGVVLTIPAAGSEMSSGTVVTNEETKEKLSFGHPSLRPYISILDPEYTFTLPSYQVACGISDILAHMLERYLTNTKSVELTDRMLESVMTTVVNYALPTINEPTNYDYRANIMWAGTLAHNGILSYGRSSCWVSHGLEHSLSAFNDISHGEGLAIIFPAYLKYAYKHNIDLLAQLFDRIFGINYSNDNKELAILQGIDRLEQFYKSLGLKTRLSEVGITKDDFDTLATHTSKLSGFIDIEYNDMIEIFELAL